MAEIGENTEPQQIQTGAKQFKTLESFLGIPNTLHKTGIVDAYQVQGRELEFLLGQFTPSSSNESEIKVSLIIILAQMLQSIVKIKQGQKTLTTEFSPKL